MKLFTTCRLLSTVLLILCASWFSPTLQASPVTSSAPIGWQSLWFLSLLFIVILLIGVLLIIWLGIRISTKQLRQQNSQLEQQVNTHAESIKQLVNQKERLFANITQEFRTPLTLSLEPMNQLIDLDSDTRIEKSANNSTINNAINNNSQLASNQSIIHQLKVALLGSNKNSHQTNLRYYSLRHTLNYIIACFDQTFTGKSLIVSISSYDDVTLSLKPDSLEIILTSLIANAVKYTNKGGSITITIEHDKKQQQKEVTITISDNGIGIEPEHQQLIFNHLGRAEQQHDTPAGTGISLALVKELITTNQGHIGLTSALNKGSSFIVTLPIKTSPNTPSVNRANPSNTAKLLTALEIKTLNSTQLSQHMAPHLSSSHSNSGQEGKSQVLIIDDNQELLNLINEILSPHFDCQLAPNGEQGLHMAQENLPDLVLCDVMMPGISGFEVLNELKTSPLTAHIPVILLTAKGDAESRIEGWKNRADEYLSKPFNNQELVARITNLLAIRKSISSRYQQQFSLASTDNTANPNAQKTDANKGASESVADGLDMVAQDFSQQLESILAKQYQDEDLTVATIATELALSQRQLIRKTKSLLGMTPNETLRAFRLKKAAEFLREGKTPSTITFDVGFSSHSYFGTCFKNQFGCTPSEYRKQHLNTPAKGTVD